MAKRRRRRLGKVERKHKALVLTSLPCRKNLRKGLQNIARHTIRTTCHDIVAECIGGPEEHKEARILVRADCTSEKTRDDFKEQIENAVAPLKAIIKR